MTLFLRDVLMLLFYIVLFPGVLLLGMLFSLLEKVGLKEIDYSGDGDLALGVIVGTPLGIIVWAALIYEAVKHIRFV